MFQFSKNNQELQQKSEAVNRKGSNLIKITVVESAKPQKYPNK